MRKVFSGIFIFLLACLGHSQNVDYAQEVLKELAGQDFYGRGYVKNGDKLAAEYIASEFLKNGLKPIDSSYFQDYEFPINTFPGKVVVKLDSEKLIPGSDYVISSSNETLKGKFNLVYLHDSIDNSEKLDAFLEKNIFNDAFLVSKNSFRKAYGKTFQSVKGFVVLTDKIPYWHVSKAGQVNLTFWLKIQEDKLTDKPTSITINVVNEFVPNHKTQNVIAIVKGKKEPRRYIVFSAHYDHLGMMGKKTMYPGANDNGSGTAMLLDLARHYAKPENQPDKSIVFMAFSGEEAGLHGSTYYVENPLFMLEGIRLLINLDMVGTGSEGITIVNSIAYKELYDDMVKINEKHNYLPEIKDRGEACNSDHCPFYNKGVKSIFIYTMGQEHLEYHTPKDSPENFPFTAYNGLFRLLTDYVSIVE